MKEMKTYEEFRDQILRSPRFKEMTFAELENEAAKEYAKQWIDRATDELNDVGVGFPEAYKRVMELKKEIDAQ